MAGNENIISGDNDTVLIKLENKIFSVKKSTLSSSSEYFRVMFSGSFLESRLRVIKINMVRWKDFKLFLDFIKEGKLRWDEINSENIARIFKTASMLQISKFIEACEVPLINDWEKFGHAGEMYTFATAYGMDGLRRNLLRLLAKCVDFALEVGTLDIYFGKGDSRISVNNSERVSYEYLLECLRETRIPGEINFGTTVKEYFNKRDRETKESKFILEWVCKWLLNFLHDKTPDDQIDKINNLLELCDLEFISFEEIEKSLNVCNKKSEIENCPILSRVRECIYKQKAHIQRNLRQIGLEYLLISPNVNRRDGVTKCLRCRSVLEDGELTYQYEYFDIPFNYTFLIPVVCGEDEEEYVCLYRPGHRQCSTFNLATKQIDLIRNIIPPIIVDSGIVAGGYLVCLGSHDRYWDCTERDHAVLATVNMETSQLTREMVYDIRLCNHYRDSNMAYMEGYFFFMGCGPEREDAYKPFLYRYDPETKKLEVSEQVYRHTNERTSKFRLVVHNRQLLVIGRDKLLVINTECFTEIDGKPVKVLNVHRNGWRVWEAISKNGSIYLMALKNARYYEDVCVADIFVFNLDLENGVLEGIGCMVDAFTNVNHRCPHSVSNCNSYASLGLITKLNSYR